MAKDTGGGGRGGGRGRAGGGGGGGAGLAGAAGTAPSGTAAQARAAGIPPAEVVAPERMIPRDPLPFLPPSGIAVPPVGSGSRRLDTSHGRPPPRAEARIQIAEQRLLTRALATQDKPGGETEGVFIFNRNGQVLYHAGGTNTSIPMPAQLRGVSRNRYSMHSHPSGGPFSVGDVNVAILNNQAQTRVVGFDRAGNVWRYTLTRPPGGWPRTALNMPQPWTHEQWQSAAQRYGLEYRRERIAYTGPGVGGRRTSRNARTALVEG